MNFKHDFSSTHVHELVGGIFEPLLVAIGGASFDIQKEFVEGLFGLLGIADVASRGLEFSLSLALVAGGLELLDKARPQSFGLDGDSLASTLGTLFDVVGVVCT